ncbi:MAG: hypothetical protein NT126_13035 [Bacteroidetes bacterium]|nr:hypothetical protein [Bacteroidota bacterium]
MKINFSLQSAILLILTSCGLIVINPTYNNLSDDQKPFYKPAAFNPSGEHGSNNHTSSNIDSASQIILQSIDSGNAAKILYDSPNSFVWFYVWASYCGPCVRKLSSINKLLSDQKNTINFILISADDYTRSINIKHLLFKNKILFPTYILDVTKYGYKFNDDQREKIFKDQFCKNCRDEVLGYPMSLVFNDQKKIIYCGVGDFNLDSLLETNEKQ